MVRVKICGITNIEDAMAAVEAGADALGFVFAESRRHVEPDDVSAIVKQLPPFITTVGVFANQPAEDVVWITLDSNLNFAQIHGKVDDFGIIGDGLGCSRVIRALRMRTEADLHDAAHACPNCGCAGMLLDAHTDEMMGGAGKTFDWELAAKASSLGRPIILAGGLTPSNVEEAVTKVRPYAVDVSTGVEASPGKKDRKKIEEFIRNAKRAV